MKKPQRSLKKWTEEEWGTKSGKPSVQGRKATGERYLPKKARESLTAAEYAATTKRKREDMKKGKQFSKQPDSIAKKTAKHRGKYYHGGQACSSVQELEKRNPPK